MVSQFISGSNVFKFFTEELGGRRTVLSPNHQEVIETWEMMTLSPIDKTGTPATIIAVISTLAPSLLKLAQPLYVRVQEGDNGYIAVWDQANIHSPGESEVDAIESLKTLIVDAYEMLSDLDPSQLGPEPTKQLSILRAVISPT